MLDCAPPKLNFGVLDTELIKLKVNHYSELQSNMTTISVRGISDRHIQRKHDVVVTESREKVPIIQEDCNKFMEKSNRKTKFILVQKTLEIHAELSHNMYSPWPLGRCLVWADFKILLHKINLFFNSVFHEPSKVMHVSPGERPGADPALRNLRRK